jgi:hypothetical protein
MEVLLFTANILSILSLNRKSREVVAASDLYTKTTNRNLRYDILSWFFILTGHIKS